MNFFIKTLGCKLNRHDSECLADKLNQLGLRESDTAKAVDFLVVNSCTVTNSADHKSRQAITHLQKEAPEAKVIVMGCGVKNDAEQFKRKTGVDFVSGEENSIVEYVKKVLSQEGTGDEIIDYRLKIINESQTAKYPKPVSGTGHSPSQSPLKGEKQEVANAAKNKLQTTDYRLQTLNSKLSTLHSKKLQTTNYRLQTTDSQFSTLNSTRTRANVKIQTGCENFCSYCIICHVRGRSVNVSSEEIIAEILEKEQQGFKEIVLTGINIGAYGASVTTRPEESTLPDLLKEILNRTAVPRIRLSSIGPQYFSDELIQVLQNDRICEHLHFSIQSCSNNVLKKMNRPYMIEEVIELAERLRQVMPEIALTSDIITGFPEETDEEHRETLENIRKVNLMKTHVFPYSVRAGTVAAKMKQVSHVVKMRRKKEVAEVAMEMQDKFRENMLGKKKQVLFEYKNNEGLWEGYTDNYLRVAIASDEDWLNEIVEVAVEWL